MIGNLAHQLFGPDCDNIGKLSWCLLEIHVFLPAKSWHGTAIRIAIIDAILLYNSSWYVANVNTMWQLCGLLYLMM